MNVKTITLTGGETAVKFDANYPYFWVQSFSDTDIYLSVSPNITPDADGVILIPAKSGGSTGDVGQCSTLYLSGSGKIQIFAQYNAVCPFRSAGKGGENDDRGYKVVDELPETGSSKYIYLVPKSSLLSDNIYNEYLWIDEEQRWELVGDTKIDLTDYAKKSELTSHINDKSNPHNVTAEQIKMNDVYNGAFGNSIGNLQNHIKIWYNSTIESLSVFRFQGNADINFYIDNWEGNSTLMDTSSSRAIYTVEVISSNVGYALRPIGTFLITLNSLQDESQNTTSFITFYNGVSWYMYGRIVTEKSKIFENILPPATTITSSSDDSTVPTSKAVYNNALNVSHSTIQYKGEGNYNGNITADIDWNDITNIGTYIVSISGDVDNDKHIAGKYGRLKVENRGENVSGLTQTFIPTVIQVGSEIKVRSGTYSAGQLVWGNWIAIAAGDATQTVSGYMSAADKAKLDSFKKSVFIQPSLPITVKQFKKLIFDTVKLNRYGVTCEIKVGIDELTNNWNDNDHVITSSPNTLCVTPISIVGNYLTCIFASSGATECYIAKTISDDDEPQWSSLKNLMN